MSLSELYEEYTRRLEEYLALQTNGKRAPTVEEQREAEAAADEWLRLETGDGQHEMKL